MASARFWSGDGAIAGLLEPDSLRLYDARPTLGQSRGMDIFAVCPPST